MPFLSPNQQCQGTAVNNGDIRTTHLVGNTFFKSVDYSC